MKPRRKKPTRRRNRRGMILVLVLMVIALLALSGYSFSELMYTERRAVDLNGRGLQCRAMADSGLEVVKRFVVQDLEFIQENGGLYDNPVRFQGIQVAGDPESVPSERGRFTVLAPIMDDMGLLAPGVRYGLEDESTRLNLNTLLLAEEYQENGGRDLLMALPGMTEQIADAILDWIDEDDETREFGAEVDYYTGLDPPYAPKNGPLDSVEELLLVRDVTPWLLFGADANRNGRIDAHEPEAVAIDGVDNADGVMDRGWSAYLTLYSFERNLNPEGELRIDINSDDLEQLYEDLEGAFGKEWALYIVAYRQNGPYTGNKEPIKKTTGELDLSQPGNTRFSTVLDLIGANVEAKFKGEESAVVIESPFPNVPIAMGAYLPVLLDQVTVNAAPIIPGRININQASRTVLLGVPGMTEEMITEILSRRELEYTGDKPNRRHETWIMSELIVTLDEMKTMIPFVTSGGHVYRAQVVGYYEEGGPASRIEAVVDATAETPRIVFWRDLSHLGRGYAVETLGIEFTDLEAQP